MRRRLTLAWFRLLDRTEAARLMKAEAWSDGWDARASTQGPACPEDHNPWNRW